jgi:N-acyl-D-amino-acid deacylase
VSELDIVLRGATIIDGSGGEPYPGDVAIAGDRIAHVGQIPAGAAAREEIDASGLMLAPGFIDIHTHSDVSLLLDPRGESKVQQGVTTDVVGNCSFSVFPLASERLSLHQELIASLGDDAFDLRWNDLDGYASVLADRRPAMNVAPLTGHGALRIAVLGLEHRAPTPGELREMQRLLDETFDQGAFGFSTGLTYVPSGYADPTEIQELGRIAARRGRIYATHARVSGPESNTGSIEEAIDVGRASGVRVQYSHAALNDPDWWGRAADITSVFERGRADGIDVGYDVYPYDASSSALTQYLPSWVTDGGTAALAARLADADTRQLAEVDLAQGFFGSIPWHWERVLVARSGPDDDESAGQTIAQLAEARRVSPEALVLDLCRRYGNAVMVVLFYRVEEDVRTFLAHPLAVVGSDGSALPLEQGTNRPHPRSFGCYPRLLGRFVREQGLLSLAEAVHKSTGAVADRIGLHDRGRVTKGLVADLVVFDAGQVADRATFFDPGQPPVGIVHVLVNGRLVVRAGEQTAERPGRVLRAA